MTVVVVVSIVVVPVNIKRSILRKHTVHVYKFDFMMVSEVSLENHCAFSCDEIFRCVHIVGFQFSFHSENDI